MDSDIYSPYGEVLQRRNTNRTSTYDYIDDINNKSRDAVWMVSHCKTQSKRMEFVEELRKYIHVDIYGKCGKFKCPRDHDDDCSKLINRTYKFYLSFDNCLSIDYVTEKFFNALHKTVIPVVRSGADFEKSGIGKDLFINASDFKTPELLASHLKYIGSDIAKYMSYLQARNMTYLKQDLAWGGYVHCVNVYIKNKNGETILCTIFTIGFSKILVCSLLI